MGVVGLLPPLRGIVLFRASLRGLPGSLIRMISPVCGQGAPAVCDYSAPEIRNVAANAMMAYSSGKTARIIVFPNTL